ncbi:hypothetical protein QBC39DRAFT_166836 [Podospora conica]|nr:hypothetical protein QBC39DRAFT_166836 [Schizothecium conicum]
MDHGRRDRGRARERDNAVTAVRPHERNIGDLAGLDGRYQVRFAVLLVQEEGMAGRGGERVLDLWRGRRRASHAPFTKSTSPRESQLVWAAQKGTMAGVSDLLEAVREVGLMRTDMEPLEIALGSGVIPRPLPETVAQDAPDLLPRWSSSCKPGYAPPGFKATLQYGEAERYRVYYLGGADASIGRAWTGVSS